MHTYRELRSLALLYIMANKRLLVAMTASNRDPEQLSERIQNLIEMRQMNHVRTIQSCRQSQWCELDVANCKTTSSIRIWNSKFSEGYSIGEQAQHFETRVKTWPFSHRWHFSLFSNICNFTPRSSNYISRGINIGLCTCSYLLFTALASFSFSA
jgi:hypothetical protein